MLPQFFKIGGGRKELLLTEMKTTACWKAVKVELNPLWPNPESNTPSLQGTPWNPLPPPHTPEGPCGCPAAALQDRASGKGDSSATCPTCLQAQAARRPCSL